MGDRRHKNAGFRCAVIEAIERRVFLSTSLISIATDGTAAGGGEIQLNGEGSTNFSPNGRYVLFTSTATNLVPGVTDTNNAADVFLRDTQTNTTAIISADATGKALGTVSMGNFAFSPDSTRLVFRAQAAGMVAGLADTNNQPDWFIRDLATGATSCLTVNAAGTSTGNSTSFTSHAPVFSPDSKSVAFISLASDLVAGVADSSGRDAFVRVQRAQQHHLAGFADDLLAHQPVQTILHRIGFATHVLQRRVRHDANGAVFQCYCTAGVRIGADAVEAERFAGKPQTRDLFATVAVRHGGFQRAGAYRVQVFEACTGTIERLAACYRARSADQCFESRQIFSAQALRHAQVTHRAGRTTCAVADGGRADGVAAGAVNDDGR